MTFREWWIQSSRKYDEQDAAYEAWNAALEEAARINEQHSKDTNLKWLMGLADRIRALKEGKR